MPSERTKSSMVTELAVAMAPNDHKRQMVLAAWYAKYDKAEVATQLNNWNLLPTRYRGLQGHKALK